MKMKFGIMVMVFATLCGCLTTPSDIDGTDVATQFRTLLRQGKYHQSFRFFPKVEEELKDTPEGALGFEYNTLLSCTANTGMNDWQSILKDSNIPIEMKQDLVDEIHETAKKIGYK